ncbi:MAG: sulfite exporter TauE/SafE family protein [Anaerolineae bacterium]|nr:sulfite exporter TauE/SafE family protein [Anaerolineae bacterium]
MLTALTLLILFVATLIRSTFGFGDALIAMPLLALLIGIQSATPLVAFISTTIAATIVWSSWREVDLRAAWRLILSSLIGIPFGLYILTAAPEQIVKGILALLLIVFGVYNLTRPVLTTLPNQQWAYVFGFIAGIFGGAYNTNGPPIVVYGTLRHWPPTRFRATLQGYFLPTGLLILIGHGLSGLWTRQIWQWYGLALPLVLLAIFMGGRLNRRIPTGRFDRLIYGALIILGAMLFV